MTEKEKKVKEKAEELILKFMRLQEPKYNWFDSKLAKKCALIAVDEILDIASGSYDIDHIDWWKKVKQEIEKL